MNVKMIIQETLQKAITHLLQDDGIRGLSYSISSFTVGITPALLNISVVDIFEILAFGATFLVGMLTSWGIIRKYLKECKEEKAKLKKD